MSGPRDRRPLPALLLLLLPLLGCTGPEQDDAEVHREEARRQAAEAEEALAAGSLRVALAGYRRALLLDHTEPAWFLGAARAALALAETEPAPYLQWARDYARNALEGGDTSGEGEKLLARAERLLQEHPDG